MRKKRELIEFEIKAFEDMASEFRVFSTGCRKLDEFMQGGVQGLMGIYGLPNTGKSFFAGQVAFYNAGQGKKILIIDTEEFWNHATIKRLGEYFVKRWNLRKDVYKRIFVAKVSSVEDLGKLFGINIDVINREARVDVFIVRGKLKESPIYRHIKSYKLDLIILDSMTNPLKKTFQSAQQNFPARSSVINAIMDRMLRIYGQLNIPFLVTHHISQNPRFMGTKAGNPYGGHDIIAFHKVLYQIGYPTEAERNKLPVTREDTHRIRKFIRRRHYGLDMASEFFLLAKDYGYTSLDYLRGGSIE